jgi:hypothetical protein
MTFAALLTSVLAAGVCGMPLTAAFPEDGDQPGGFLMAFDAPMVPFLPRPRPTRRGRLSA